jgi:NUMOD3 motif
MFYTYLWLRYDGTPYYAGKGKDRRAFIDHKNGKRLIRCPKDIDDIIIEYHFSEADAFEAEMFLISYYGRKDLGTGCLRNLTDGGDGTSGATWMRGENNPMFGVKREFSTEWRVNLGNSRRGKTFTAAHRAKLGLKGELNPMFGKKCNPSAETRLKISQALSGRTHSEEHRRNSSIARKGVKFSDERRRQMSVVRTGRLLYPPPSPTLKWCGYKRHFVDKEEFHKNAKRCKSCASEYNKLRAAQKKQLALGDSVLSS